MLLIALEKCPKCGEQSLAIYYCSSCGAAWCMGHDCNVELTEDEKERNGNFCDACMEKINRKWRDAGLMDDDS